MLFLEKQNIRIPAVECRVSQMLSRFMATQDKAQNTSNCLTNILISGFQVLRAFIIHFLAPTGALIVTVIYYHRTQVYLGSDLWVLVSVCLSVSNRRFADLTDVTLTYEDTNSRLT